MNSSIAKLLVFFILLLPAGCLLWKWSALPQQVPLHFSAGGDRYGNKHVLWALVLLPVVLYLTLPLLARRNFYATSLRAVATGTALALSLLLTGLVLTSASAI